MHFQLTVGIFFIIYLSVKIRFYICVVILILCVFTFDVHATNIYLTKTGRIDGSSDSVCFIKPGASFYYYYTVVNNSAVEAINVVLTDPLVDHIEIGEPISSTQGSCIQRAGLTCELGNIPPSGSVTAWAAAQLGSDAVLNSDVTNTATVTADNEIDPTDNTSSYTFTVADVTETCRGWSPSSGGCSLLRKPY